MLKRASTTVVLATMSLMFANVAQAQDNSKEDYMKGQGIFNTNFADPSELVGSKYNSKWYFVSPDDYTFKYEPAVGEEKDYIEMTKKTGSEGFFDDGLTYLFTNEDGSLAAQRPKHIHFEVRTTTADVETCDFRFYSVEKVVEEEEEGRRLSLTEGQDQQNHDQSKKATTGFSSEAADKKKTVITAAPTGPSKEFKKVEFSDVAFFRLGYFDFLKLNTQNMIMKFEEKSWYSVDLILNYDDQRVSIYVNDKPYKSASFFTQRKEKLSSGNAISIYGLSPEGVS